MGNFIQPIMFFTFAFVVLLPNTAEAGSVSDKPNVIMVITDDQGYGDLGIHGNTIIQTPNLDRFASESVRLTNFHVSPTCAPTRAALMTGRYTNRTGCWHTIAGRSLLFEDEKTLAQVFAENGYKTGHFGKWHLGDNYPFRPEDRGFQEVVRHGGGGIGQAPDYWANEYFDNTFWRNGNPEKFPGYCTDVFFGEAIRFIEKHAKEPFFCYITTNAPHDPLHVPEKYYNAYKNNNSITEEQKRFYGMITNIDDNFKILDDKLKSLGLMENTVLVFLTDNGTAYGLRQRDGKTYGYNAGMRGTKNSEYDGGHRVPFFIRWPAGNIGGGKEINTLTAHIDVMPTLIDLCALKFIETKSIDGISLKPLLENASAEWPNRMLIVDSQRLQNLVKWRKSAVMDREWRLVNGKELYRINEDPSQKSDVSEKFPEVVRALRTAYEHWWSSLVSEQVNQRYAYIKAGTPYENPVRLSSHDLHSDMFDRAWHQHGVLLGARTLGVLKIEIVTSGSYTISLRRYPRESNLGLNDYWPGTKETVEISEPMPKSTSLNWVEASLSIGDVWERKPVGKADAEIVFDAAMQEGKYDLQAIFTDSIGRRYPAYYVYIEKKDKN